MKRILVLLAAGAAGCASTDPEGDLLGRYDRLDMMQALYDSALDKRDYNEMARLEVGLTREAVRGLEMYIRDCGDRDDRRRRLAAWVLGFSKRAEAAAPLRALLDDPLPRVRVTAAVALGELGVPNPPIERVKKMLDEPSEFERKGALFALKRLLGPGQDAGLVPRLVGLLDDPSTDIRNEAVLLMGRIRRPEFIDPLARKAFRDEFFFVRYNAALVIGGYGPGADAILPHLIELLRDLEAIVVQAAHHALKKVTERDFDRSYHTWRDWYEEEQAKYEYYCPTDPDIVRPVAGVCPKCNGKFERRLKPAVPKREEKEEKK